MVIQRGGVGAGMMRTKCRDTVGVGTILRYVPVRTFKYNNTAATQFNV